MIDFFDRGAAIWPDRVFLSGPDTVRTYAQSQASSFEIASAMKAAGFKQGMRAAILSPNDVDAIECLLGIFRAGGAWVSLNARSAESELARIIDLSGVSFLFVHSRQVASVPELLERCPGLSTVICLGENEAGLPVLADWKKTGTDPGPAYSRDPDAVFAVYSTGGTTGQTKCVVHTNLTLETKLATLMIHMPPSKPPVNLVVAPFTHAAGTIMQALMSQGATNIVLPGFDAGEVLQAIEAHRVSYLFLPPTAIYVLLDHPDLERYDYSSLEYFIYAAAPMSVEKLERAIAVFGPVMAQTYGQVEAPNICTFLSPREHAEAMESDRRRLASCGRASALTQVEIVDDVGCVVAPEKHGEIVVRGNLVMHGYLDEKAGAIRLHDRNKWHHTGDIGVKDRDGYVYIVDRQRDMIISGGFNVYPSEVEQVIWSHGDVTDCAVIGIPHPKWGEAVHAVVELRDGAKLDPDALIAYCRARLGGIKTPKSVEFVKALPRSAVGKVLKKDLRDRYWSQQERRI